MTVWRLLLLISVCLASSACGSTPTTWAKPGATIEAYQKDSAECRTRSSDFAGCMAARGYKGK